LDRFSSKNRKIKNAVYLREKQIFIKEGGKYSHARKKLLTTMFRPEYNIGLNKYGRKRRWKIQEKGDVLLT